MRGYYTDTTLTEEQKNIIAEYTDSLKQEVADAEKEFGLTTMLDFKNLRNELADSAIAAYNAIAANLSIEQWNKTINMIYLNTYTQDIDTFTAEQWSSIVSLAFTCAVQGGEATALARSLYMGEVGATLFDDNNLCTQYYSKKEKETIRHRPKRIMATAAEGTTTYKVYPNPASNMLWVAANAPEDKLCIALVNAHGATIASGKVNIVGGKGSIALKEVASGLYYLNIASNGVTLVSAKLNVIK